MTLETHSFKCKRCQRTWTDSLDDSKELYRQCPSCGTLAPRIVGTLTMPLSMGCDPSFPTAWDKWSRVHKQQTKIAERLKREHGDNR